jgi:hypothetical protein
MTCALSAQVPRVGLIEYYGHQKLSPERITQLAGVRVGDPLPPAKAELEHRIESSDDVISAHAEGYCCLGDKIVLYLGVLESGARPFPLHSPPTEDLQLPLKLDLVYQRLVRALESAHERGLTKETYDRGYPISEDEEARRAQETLALLVDPLVEDLGQVIRRAADEQARIAAAYILAYTKERKAAEAHLQYALRDFHPDVRQNALRSLEFVRRSLAAQPPAGEPHTISTTWLIEMLRSVTFADRVEAAKMLVRLTEDRAPSVMATLEERSLVELTQMAMWKTPEHAEAPYILLGRLIGTPEDQILSSFRANQKEVVLDAIRKRAAEKKRFLLF